jgi:large subunit ribosomal protein L4|tara:strand:+ start:2399 stop:3022 length:624 start_codon:yes stop_codon:yes gene_type:complete
MKIETFDINGKGKSIEIPEKIFSAKVNEKLISHAFYSNNANTKLRIAKTKQKNEIIGSTKKIYAQKGTGGARHASKKAPIFVGGGVAHGPKGGGNYKVRKLNKKEKKLSLISIFSKKNKDKLLSVFEDFKTKISKTKEFSEFIKKYQIENCLIVVDKNSKKNIELSARNIPNIKITMVEFLNIFDVLKYKKIIFTISAIKIIEERFK